MGVKNTVFFLDLKLLDKKVDDDLKQKTINEIIKNKQKNKYLWLN